MNRQTTLPLPTVSQLTFSTQAGANFAEQRCVRLYDQTEAAPPVSSFVPMHYETNYAYPLIVWFHGTGQSDRDLPNVMRHVSLRNYLAAAPRGLDRADGQQGYDWPDTPSGVEEAQDRLHEAIEHAQEHMNVHTDRIFLAGMGSGGTLALRLALASPWSFAGAASFDGPMPERGSVLPHLDAARSLPLLLSASRNSPRYPESQLCGDLRLLHSAGATLSIRQYPGGDDLTTEMLADFDRWLMEIVCGTTANV